MNATTTFQVGDRVTWRHEPRGGWGYVFNVPAVVVGLGRARVKIEVRKTSGELVTRHVEPESLKKREG